MPEILTMIPAVGEIDFKKQMLEITELPVLAEIFLWFIL